jgi:UDP-glucose 4-epimerase
MTTNIRQFSDQIRNKTILVTGGTGSFGHTAVEHLLTLDPKQIIIFSRDEKKQFDMGNRYNNDKLKFVVGDIRDKETIGYAMKDVDLVFHAAALKQVPNCEFFPMEAIKTNAIGAYNVINAAIDNGVQRVVVLSTDKAVYPINVMGMTKALMERIMIAAAQSKRGKTVLCATRYGNVMYSRGSVIPFFVELMKRSKPLTITDGKMTRFMMTLDDSVDLVLYALGNGRDGEIYVKKSPAAAIETLAQAMISLFSCKRGIKEIGIRPGEKMHETLISSEELLRTEDCGNYFRIHPEFSKIDYRKYYFEGNKNAGAATGGYTSENAKQLSPDEMKNALLSLEEIRQELKLIRI